MENVSNKTLIGVGIGAIVLAGAVYWLSMDKDEALEPNTKHTLAKLKEILE